VKVLDARQRTLVIVGDQRADLDDGHQQEEDSRESQDSAYPHFGGESGIVESPHRTACEEGCT
jgi:hypothetical protein